jgi:hypothetical protein
MTIVGEESTVEQLLQWAASGLRLALAGLLALAPGTIFWLVVLAVFWLSRRLGGSGLVRRLGHRNRMAPGP